MTTLAEIKTGVDTVKASAERVEQALVDANTSLASVQKKLDDAIANAADPAAMQDIKDELTDVQTKLDAAVAPQ